MILCVSIGNTNIRCALGTPGNYRQALIKTRNIASAKCFADFLCKSFGKELQLLTGGIFSSVVPHKNTDILHAIKLLSTGSTPVPISPIDIAKMSVDFSGYKSAIGEDRAVCSMAAAKKYGAPVIVIDFGTATTINVVNENNAYIGGAILAGVQTGINALAKDTARLPQLDLSESSLAGMGLIGNDTHTCIISGAVIGAACAAEGYVQRIQSVFSESLVPPPMVIITGGNASKVMPHCGFEFTYEPNLLIEGLFMHYEITR